MKSLLRFVGIVFAALVLLGGVFTLMWFVFWQGNGAALRATPVRDTDWKSGNPDAGVVLLEYSDFECPACKLYEPMMEQIRRDYATSVLFAYRHFPLPQHRHSSDAAKAAEAAGAQGKFWDMARLLFAGQDAWAGRADAAPVFESYARQLGLDMGRFRSDMKSLLVAQKVARDYETAVADKIPGTPTFFLNGVLVQFRSYEEFQHIVDRVLAG